MNLLRKYLELFIYATLILNLSLLRQNETHGLFSTDGVEVTLLEICFFHEFEVVILGSYAEKVECIRG